MGEVDLVIAPEALHADAVCATLLLLALGLALCAVAWVAAVLDGSRPLVPPRVPPVNRRRTTSGTYRAGDPRVDTARTSRRSGAGGEGARKTR